MCVARRALKNIFCKMSSSVSKFNCKSKIGKCGCLVYVNSLHARQLHNCSNKLSQNLPYFHRSYARKSQKILTINFVAPRSTFVDSATNCQMYLCHKITRIWIFYHFSCRVALRFYPIVVTVTGPATQT